MTFADVPNLLCSFQYTKTLTGWIPDSFITSPATFSFSSKYFVDFLGKVGSCCRRVAQENAQDSAKDSVTSRRGVLKFSMQLLLNHLDLNNRNVNVAHFSEYYLQHES